MHWSNQLFVVNWQNMSQQKLLDLHPTYVLRRPMANACEGKDRWDSRPCGPQPVFRLRRIPKFAVLMGGPYVANLTVELNKHVTRKAV